MKRSVSSSIEDQNAKIALSLSFKTIWLTVPSSNKDKETAAPPANGSIKVPPCLPDHSSICFITVFSFPFPPGYRKGE